MDRVKKYFLGAFYGFGLYFGLTSLGRGINNEFLTSYSSSFGMLSAYSFFRIVNDKKQSLVASIFFASLTEVLQKHDLVAGNYDPKDFLGYAIGATACFALDSIRFKRKNLENAMD